MLCQTISGLKLESVRRQEMCNRAGDASQWTGAPEKAALAPLEVSLGNTSQATLGGCSGNFRQRLIWQQWGHTHCLCAPAHRRASRARPARSASPSSSSQHRRLRRPLAALALPQGPTQFAPAALCTFTAGSLQWSISKPVSLMASAGSTQMSLRMQPHSHRAAVRQNPGCCKIGTGSHLAACMLPPVSKKAPSCGRRSMSRAQAWQCRLVWVQSQLALPGICF